MGAAPIAQLVTPHWCNWKNNIRIRKFDLIINGRIDYCRLRLFDDGLIIVYTMVIIIYNIERT